MDIPEFHFHEKIAYTSFARVYDSFMRNIPYGRWRKNVAAYLTAEGFSGCRMLELGCGTGAMTIRMAKEGYRLSGLDVSLQMIAIAKNKSRQAGVQISYSVEDMRAFTVRHPYPVIISLCDSMNYLTTEKDLEATFACVRDALKPGGIFLFDLKTEGFYKELGQQTFTDTNEQGTYIWENDYDPETRDNFYAMTFFIRDPIGFYHRHEEEHLQHAFLPEEVFRAAKNAGLTVKAHLGMDLVSPADLLAERTYVVLRKPE